MLFGDYLTLIICYGNWRFRSSVFANISGISYLCTDGTPSPQHRKQHLCHLCFFNTPHPSNASLPSHTPLPICFRLAFFISFSHTRNRGWRRLDFPIPPRTTRTRIVITPPHSLCQPRNERRKKTRNHFTPGGGIAENKTYPGSSTAEGLAWCYSSPTRAEYE